MERKICTKCKKDKNNEDFYTNIRNVKLVKVEEV